MPTPQPWRWIDPVRLAVETVSRQIETSAASVNYVERSSSASAAKEYPFLPTRHNSALDIIAEVDGLRRDHDPHPVRREDRDAVFSAETISASRQASVAASSRTVTLSRTTSRRAPLASATPLPSARTTSGANSTASSAAGRTRRPSRARRRQRDNWVSCMPYRRATPRTVAPASSVSATIRALSSDGQRRRPPDTGSISTLLRVEIEVCIQTLAPAYIAEGNRKSELQVEDGALAPLTILAPTRGKAVSFSNAARLKPCSLSIFFCSFVLSLMA